MPDKPKPAEFKPGDRVLEQEVIGLTDARITKSIYDAVYVCVPIEPTKEMIDAAYWAAYEGHADQVWEAMIKAWLVPRAKGIQDR